MAELTAAQVTGTWGESILPGECLKKEAASMTDVLHDAQRMLFWFGVHPSR